MKVLIHTTGCRSNQADSCVLARNLAAQGFEVVAEGPADVYVINACTLTAKADRKARNLVYRARTENPKGFVVVVGCLADRLQQFPQEDFFQGKGPDLLLLNREKPKLAQRLASLLRVREKGGKGLQRYHTRRLLKVQDGCPRNCSYCIVPLVRGRKSVSIPLEQAVMEAKRLEEEGAQEIVLTGIHLGLYGRDLDPRRSLAQLVREVLGTTDHVLVRLSSLEPEELRPELIEVLGEERVCAHLHLPLQSGSNKVLRDMHRPYTSEIYVELVRKVREVRPEISIGVDVIVGYPTETDDDFKQTVKTIEEVQPAYLHVFRYSPRPGTPAAPLGDPVPYEVKHERARLLGEMSRRYREDFARSHIGRLVKVVPVKRAGGLMEGLTDTYVKILYGGPKDRMVLVKVTGFEKGFLKGEVV